MMNPYNSNYNPMNPQHQALNASQFVGFKKPKDQLWINAAVKKFGYVYDDRFAAHDCPYDKNNSDKPERTKIIHDRLKADGLLNGAVKVEARPATDDELALVHHKSFISELTGLTSAAACEEYCKKRELLYLGPESEKTARLATGGVIDLVKASVEGKCGNGFAIVRPQGHNAGPEETACNSVYNHVAIAAKYATTKLGLDRVAVVDLDIHAPTGSYMALRDSVHGNSNKSKVFMASIHAYHHGLMWPYTQDFDYDVREGNMMFFPLNAPMNTEGEYMAIFNHAILPALREYKPQLIILAAGFDSGYCDVMLDAGQGVKAHGFAHMARDLHEIAQDRVIAVLEGGSHPTNISECSSMMVKGLQGKPFPRVYHPERLNGCIIESIFMALIHNKDRFRCFPKLLEKLQAQQHKNGFPELVLPQQRLFLGAGVRDMWEDIKAAKMCRTRELAPDFPPQYSKIADQRIDDYKKHYVNQENELIPEDFLAGQMLYDEKAKADSYLKSSGIVQQLYTMLLDFKVGRSKNFLICDRAAMSSNKNMVKYLKDI